MCVIQITMTVLEPRKCGVDQGGLRALTGALSRHGQGHQGRRGRLGTAGGTKPTHRGGIGWQEFQEGCHVEEAKAAAEE